MSVTRFELIMRRPLAGGAAFGPAGEVGPYEELKGRLHFAIDPLHPANRRITDVELAPRNAAGRVEWWSDVSILLPVDRSAVQRPRAARRGQPRQYRLGTQLQPRHAPRLRPRRRIRTRPSTSATASS